MIEGVRNLLDGKDPDMDGAGDIDDAQQDGKSG